MIRKGATLYAVDEMSAEALSHIPAGEIVMVVPKARRNPKQHRLVWALASKIVEATGAFQDSSECVEWLLIKSKHIRSVIDPKTGQVWVSAKSISFADLDQAQFSRLLKRMIYVICSEVLPGVKEKTLQDEILKMIEGRRAA